MKKHRNASSSLKLENGSKVAVIGGGPAGSFFTYFLLEMAARVKLQLQVDIYEPKDFFTPGPANCNHCGGIVSESLVQLLATEGIKLPPSVVQKAIDSYIIHTDTGSRRIDPPTREKRIAALFRGSGPRGIKEQKYRSFDGFLLELASDKGNHIDNKDNKRHDHDSGKPVLITKEGDSHPYDLVTVAAGVNSTALKIFADSRHRYRPPQKTRTFIGEIPMDPETIQTYMGHSMHVFLLNLPRLEFAALIPKSDYITLCLLGDKIDNQLVDMFLNSPAVKRLLPPGKEHESRVCHCAPFINTKQAGPPFCDRVVLIGDSGATRLYKDGIGAAYRTAKACASTAVFHGVSAEDFNQHYYKAAYKAICTDNIFGKLTFAVINVVSKLGPARRGILRLVDKEQQNPKSKKRMSAVLWDSFTGSASYRAIFRRTLHPAFLSKLLLNCAASLSSSPGKKKNQGNIESKKQESSMKKGDLGKVYHDGEIIVRQDETGDCMFVIQTGEVEVIRQTGDRSTLLAVLREGDFFGEMALFEEELRSAAVRAKGSTRVLSVDKKTLLSHIQVDPSLAFSMIRKMSQRIRELDKELSRT
jgi:flavin-dependent dehydrogenase